MLARVELDKGQRGESMRLTKLPNTICLLLMTAFSAPCLRAQDTNDSSAGRSGTAPRSSADKYHAHAKHAGVNIGADMQSHKEVSKEFAADVNLCCLVVQVAVYPQKEKPLYVSMDDFSLIVGGTDTPVSAAGV